MTPELINRHRKIWSILAVIIPLGIYAATRNLNIHYHPFDEQVPSRRGSIPGVAFENERLILTKSRLEKTTLVTIVLKEPLKHPSTTVYGIDKEQSRQLLGQIASTGTYQFESEEDWNTILLYDEIKNLEIDKIKF
ncbi:MAG: hypothetical protein KDC80_09550 [Saprospiraceae bacterium]|nr:hypothetical protein [Saprospiraceae bacterium]